MKKIIAAFIVSAAFIALIPAGFVFAKDAEIEEEIIEETAVEEVEEKQTNGSKMKKGASEFFQGLKGSVQDGADTAKAKVHSATASAYIGEWYFANGKYATMIILEEDGTAKITQTKSTLGENEWTGTYTVPEKKQILFHAQKKNGRSADKEFVLNFEAEKKDYLIISSDSLPDDPNGYDFSNRTLFNYVKPKD